MTEQLHEKIEVTQTDLLSPPQLTIRLDNGAKFTIVVHPGMLEVLCDKGSSAGDQLSASIAVLPRYANSVFLATTS